MGFPAIFEKGPKPIARNKVVNAGVYTYQAGADLRFNIVCGVLQKIGEVDGETECIAASRTHVSSKKAL